MHIRNVFTGAVALCLMPACVSALTNDEALQQVSALISEITSLQAQLSELRLAPTTPTVSSNQVCPKLYRPLSLGLSGSDVASLQAFLSTEPTAAYGGSITGYFGPATEAAIQRWQTAHGIVSSGDAKTTGFGAVGKRTAAAILGSCSSVSSGVSQSQPPLSCPIAPPPTSTCASGWQANTDAYGCTRSYKCSYSVLPLLSPHPPTPSPPPVTTSFTLSAQVGAAPLTVTFVTGRIRLAGDRYFVNFGDGSDVGVMYGGNCSQEYPLVCTFSTYHTYTRAGVYVASLIRQSADGVSNTIATAPATIQ